MLPLLRVKGHGGTWLEQLPMPSGKLLALLILLTVIFPIVASLHWLRLTTIITNICQHRDVTLTFVYARVQKYSFLRLQAVGGLRVSRVADAVLEVSVRLQR